MSRTGKAVTAAVLASAIMLVAFTTISLGISSDGSTTGNSAQTPVGVHTGQAEGGVLGGGPEGGAGAGGGENPASVGGVRDAGAGAGAGSQGSKLPFTGLLAIPILLTGTGLLVAGLVIRRRTPASATA